jgi:hypothetical protein
MQRIISAGPAIPDKLPMSDLDSTKELMNKIMKKYIDQVRAEPKMYIKEKGPVERLFGLQSAEKRFPTMFADRGLPSFSKVFLYGLDWDFLMLEVLVIALMDRCNYLQNDIQSGLAFGVLIAYLIDYFLIYIRVHFGRRNLATHTLSDERFLIS